MAFTGAAGLGSAAAASQGAGGLGKSNSTIANDFSTFLTLLTTQLQNQDPMDPTDSNEFTKQIVSFAGVEQQIAQNENLKALQAQMSHQNLTNSVSYLGNQATVPTDTLKYSHSSEASQFDHGTWQYGITNDVSEARISVLDSDGELVKEETVNVSLGMNDYRFDGLDADGNEVPTGNYSLKVELFNSEGNIILDEDGSEKTAPVFLQAPVTAVDTSSGEPLFTVGVTVAKQSDILQLSVPTNVRPVPTEATE